MTVCIGSEAVAHLGVDFFRILRRSQIGFSEAVARAVIDGLRACRRGVDPFDPERKTSRGRPRGKSSGPKLLPAVLTPPTQQGLLV